MATLTWELIQQATPAPEVLVDANTASPSALAVARDFKIDLVTRERVIVNGDWALVTGLDAIRQDLDMRLQFFLGEWFLDETEGVPFFEVVLVKQPDPERIRSALRTVIMGTLGVRSLDSLTLTYEPADRSLLVEWRVTTDLGLLNSSTPVALT